jgi:hypothetical protein
MFTFMQGVYSYIPDTNHFCMVYSYFPKFIRSAQYDCILEFLIIIIIIITITIINKLIYVFTLLFEM